MAKRRRTFRPAQQSGGGEETMAYRIFTDAAADPGQFAAHVEVIPMTVRIGGRDFLYGPGGNLTVREFYRLRGKGMPVQTAGISPESYRRAFTPCLERGLDLVYLSFSSGLSGTYASARLCARELREQYPDRQILCVDTLCASAGQGFLVREAAQRQAAGFSAQELAGWAEDHRLAVCHWFTVDTVTYLRQGGRLGAAVAAAGTALNINPLLHLDRGGRLALAGRARGRKNAIEMQAQKLRNGWEPNCGRRVSVAHAADPAGAEQLRCAIAREFPKAEIDTVEIGPVIGAHTGPGMLAVLYWGSNR